MNWPDSLQQLANSLKSSMQESRRQTDAKRASLHPPIPAEAIKKKGETLGEYLSRREKEEALPRNVLHGVAITETGGTVDPINARSGKDAIGLFQQREIFREEYQITDSSNPVAAAEGTIKALKDLKKRFGDWDRAIAAYNAGPARIWKDGVQGSSTETREYVHNVKAYMEDKPPLRKPGRAFKEVMNTPIDKWHKETR